MRYFVVSLSFLFLMNYTVLMASEALSSLISIRINESNNITFMLCMVIGLSCFFMLYINDWFEVEVVRMLNIKKRMMNE